MNLLRLSTLALTTAVIFSILLLVGAQDSAYAISFNPDSRLTLADPAAGANSDIVTEFCVGDILSIHDPLCANSLAEDSNFGGVVTFINPAVGVATDADVPDGALVAQLTSEATLGLLNNACNSKILVGFDLMDATTDKSNMIDPLPPGEVDVLRPLVDDDDGDGLENAVERYPSFLETLFPGITPRARQFGWTVVTGVPDAITLNFLIFEPGTVLRSDELPNIPDFDPALGFPNVVILNDPTAPPAQSVISDFCSPLYSKTTTFGLTKTNPRSSANEGGVAYRTNPSSAGTYTTTVFAASQRDADGDGIENGLDPCPLTPDPDWDPRQTMVATGIPGDADADGLPDACDPNPSSPSPFAPNACPAGNTGLDEDQDCFSNRQDNCPLLSNPGAPSEPKAPDADSDGIGDACDPDPNDAGAQGEFTSLFLESTWIVIGDGTPAPTPTPTALPDSDSDGVPDVDDVCPNTPSGASVDASGCSEAQLAELTEEAKEKCVQGATAGVNLCPALDTVVEGGVTDIVAVCADPSGGPISGAQITFKIDSQPASDANLDGQTQVTKTSDAEGAAIAELNVGNTAGEIVVSASAVAEGCEAKTVNVTVKSASGGTADGAASGTGAAGGAATGVGSLAPAVSSIPAWAAIASGLGGAGLLGSLAAFVSRALRRRR